MRIFRAGSALPVARIRLLTGRDEAIGPRPGGLRPADDSWHAGVHVADRRCALMSSEFAFERQRPAGSGADDSATPRRIALGPRLATVLLLAALAPGCGVPQGSTPPDMPADRSVLARRADSLAALDPEAEARKAIVRGDLRFLGTCGFACEPTGIDPTVVEVSQHGLRIIEGTSDAITSKEVARLNAVAADYATRYNQVILRARLDRSRRP